MQSNHESEPEETNDLMEPVYQEGQVHMATQTVGNKCTPETVDRCVGPDAEPTRKYSIGCQTSYNLVVRNKLA